MARQQSKSVLLYSGVTAPTITQQEVSNVTTTAWSSGDLVHITATGYVTVSTGVFILGIATVTASGVDHADFDVELLDLNALYTITAEADTATARTDLGRTVDITYTVGAHVVALTENNNVIQILGIYEGNDDTTTGGKYIVRFNSPTVQPGLST